MIVWLDELFSWLPDEFRTVVLFGVVICVFFGLIRIIKKVLDLMPFV